MLHAAASSSDSVVVVAAIIGAVGAVLAAVLMAAVAWRAQTAKDQLEAIEDLLREQADRSVDEMLDELRRILDARTRGLYIAEIVKKALRAVLREERHDRQLRRQELEHEHDNGDD